MAINSGKKAKWLLSGTVVLIISLSCIVLLLVGNSSAVPGLSTNLCVGWTTTPRFQLGIAWVSPLSSYMPPLMISRYKLCVDLSPGLAPRRINGEFMLPP